MPEITNDLMDMIIADESPSSVSDKIKDILFAKSSEKVDAARPEVASKSFNSTSLDEVEPSTPEDSVESPTEE